MSVIMVLNVYRNHKACQGWGERGERDYGGGGKGDYLSLDCHHQNDYCIKMESNESHFKVSLIVRGSHKTVSTNYNLFEEKGEPKRNQAKARMLTSLMHYCEAKLALSRLFQKNMFCKCKCNLIWILNIYFLNNYKQMPFWPVLGETKAIQWVNLWNLHSTLFIHLAYLWNLHSSLFVQCSQQVHHWFFWHVTQNSVHQILQRF